MNAPLTVVVVAGDGARVVRFGLPRVIVYGALGVATVTAAAVLGLSGERVLLGRQAREVAALRQRLVAERALIASFETRVLSVRM